MKIRTDFIDEYKKSKEFAKSQELFRFSNEVQIIAYIVEYPNSKILVTKDDFKNKSTYDLFRIIIANAKKYRYEKINIYEIIKFIKANEKYSYLLELNDELLAKIFFDRNFRTDSKWIFENMQKSLLLQDNNI